jgi:hypothetical protein
VILIVGGRLLVRWNDGPYPEGLRIGLSLVSFLGGGLALFFLVTTFGAAARDYEMMVLAGLRYIGTSAAALLVTLLPSLPWWAILSVIVLFLWRYRDYSLAPILAYWRSK